MRVPTGLVLVLVGLLWVLQGLDVAFAPKSFMTGEPVWVGLGAGAAALGVLLLLKRR